ncbi:MAG: hypothetical protein WAM76_19315 [Pseudolabrys sp.]
MNNDILIGVVLLAIAGGLIFIGLPNKAGVSPRFLRFEAAVVLFPPLVLTFFAGGFAELLVGLLRSGQ